MRTSILSITSALALLLAAAAWSDSFPRTTVQTLAGSAFVLPDDLEAAADILVVGFTQKAGSNTKPWTERLARDFTRADGFAVYPVAVLAGVPALFRSFALNSIRGGVDPQEYGHFLIVDHDESAWRTAAGYALPDDPYIIVLDKSGSVLARFKGVFDEKSYEDTAVRIRSITGGKS
ncbi:MAG: hypothetical protein ACLQCB_21435 [Spirochaetia bacterium]